MSQLFCCCRKDKGSKDKGSKDKVDRFKGIVSKTEGKQRKKKRGVMCPEDKAFYEQIKIENIRDKKVKTEDFSKYLVKSEKKIRKHIKEVPQNQDQVKQKWKGLLNKVLEIKSLEEKEAQRQQKLKRQPTLQEKEEEQKALKEIIVERCEEIKEEIETELKGKNGNLNLYSEQFNNFKQKEADSETLECLELVLASVKMMTKYIEEQIEEINRVIEFVKSKYSSVATDFEEKLEEQKNAKLEPEELLEKLEKLYDDLTSACDKAEEEDVKQIAA